MSQFDRSAPANAYKTYDDPTLHGTWTRNCMEYPEHGVYALACSAGVRVFLADTTTGVGECVQLTADDAILLAMDILRNARLTQQLQRKQMFSA